MAQVVWSENAKNDIKLIADFIAQDSKYYASSFVRRVVKVTEKLTAFPEMGRVVPEYEREDIREIIFHNYRIIYKVGEDKIFIVTVIHASQDLVRRFDKESWDVV